MKNQKILLWFLLMSAHSVIANLHEERIMKLINTQTQFVIVEFKNGQPQFYDRFLEKEMQQRGISIPLDQRPAFHGKKTIYLSDPEFQKAFIEIYVPLSIASPIYQWEE